MGHSAPSGYSAWPRPSPIFIKFGRVNIFGPNMKNPKFCDDWFIPAPMRRKICFWYFTKITIFKRLYLWMGFTNNRYILGLEIFFHVEHNGVLEIPIKRRLLCDFWEYIKNLHFWRKVYIFFFKIGLCIRFLRLFYMRTNLRLKVKWAIPGIQLFESANS